MSLITARLISLFGNVSSDGISNTLQDGLTMERHQARPIEYKWSPYPVAVCCYSEPNTRCLLIDYCEYANEDKLKK